MASKNGFVVCRSGGSGKLRAAQRPVADERGDVVDRVGDDRRNQTAAGQVESAENDAVKGRRDRALSTLTERERDVVKLFFGIGVNHGLTLEEIGDKFDLTRERVRQIKEKAIRRLRHSSRSKLLQQYLG